MKPNKSFWNIINYRLKRADVEWIHGELKIFYSLVFRTKKPHKHYGPKWTASSHMSSLIKEWKQHSSSGTFSHYDHKIQQIYWDFKWQDNTLGTRGGKWCFSQLQRSAIWGRVSPRFRDLVDNVFVHFPFEIASGSIRPDWGCLNTILLNYIEV